MLTYTGGDIFESGAEALVNPVNCVGVMGKGLALQFKQRFPENFDHYAKMCARNGLRPGVLFVGDYGSNRIITSSWGGLLPCKGESVARYIVNFPTKRHWRDKSLLADVEAGLGALALFVQEEGVCSIAIPPLGCGLGGLAWEDVRPLIAGAFENLPCVQALVFAPS
ncbi:MAG: macro domain-containing protein [Actinomycetaceae bacterium]|nr:macro domain-containing protein [Actinomycetaceae bacterium]